MALPPPRAPSPLQGRWVSRRCWAAACRRTGLATLVWVPAGRCLVYLLVLPARPSCPLCRRWTGQPSPRLPHGQFTVWVAAAVSASASAAAWGPGVGFPAPTCPHSTSRCLARHWRTAAVGMASALRRGAGRLVRAGALGAALVGPTPPGLDPPPPAARRRGMAHPRGWRAPTRCAPLPAALRAVAAAFLLVRRCWVPSPLPPIGRPDMPPTFPQRGPLPAPMPASRHGRRRLPGQPLSTRCRRWEGFPRWDSYAPRGATAAAVAMGGANRCRRRPQPLRATTRPPTGTVVA